MNQTSYTPGTERPTYVDRNDNKLIKMILPFIVGLIVGFGANGLIEKSQHDNANNAQYQSGSPNH